MFETSKVRVNILLVFAHHSQNDFRTFLEDAFLLKDAKCVDDVLGQSERNYFGYFKFGAFFENAIEVDMGHFPCMLVNQDVVAMSVA